MTDIERFIPAEAENPARAAADAFILFACGLSLDQMAQTVIYRGRPYASPAGRAGHCIGNAGSSETA